jgi:FMN phosphatase YigB (HAD superfamily)
MSKSLDKKIVVLFDIDYTIFDTARFKETNFLEYRLFVEVAEVLRKISENAIVGIFSEGDLERQLRKIKETKIGHIFHRSHMHIVPRKDEVIEVMLKNYGEYDRLFLVDDKLTILYAAKKCKPDIFTVWVKRGYYAMKQEPIPGFQADAVIERLDEILPLVNG